MKTFIIVTLSMAFITSVFQLIMIYRFHATCERRLNCIEKRLEAIENHKPEEPVKRTRRTKKQEPIKITPDIEQGTMMAYDRAIEAIDVMEGRIKNGVL